MNVKKAFGIGIGAVITVLGAYKYFTIKEPQKYSSKWFDTVSDEVLKSEREVVRKQFCSAGDDFSFHVWIFRMWGNRLWLFIYLKNCIAHPTLSVALPVPDEIAAVFKFSKCREDSVGTFLADGGKPSRGELPAIIE